VEELKFKFISDAFDTVANNPFTVVSFKGEEAISALYCYEIEIKAPLSTVIDLDDVLDSPAKFVSELEGQEYPVHGILSSLDELQTVLGHIYYRVTLVPKLWRLSLYKTNEIYTDEKTVDTILRTVLKAGELSEGMDFDLNGLDCSHFLSRDYVCQFGESDFDFISRLMENEGIFYYFEQFGLDSEKMIFINDMNYDVIRRPGLFFDVSAMASQQHDCINAWSCRRQRLAKNISVRDFNPDQPSLDISDTVQIDRMGQGTEYIYGEHIVDIDEAKYLTNIRAEERLCHKTRYYGESSVSRLQAGYIFALKQGHPNSSYNGVEYLAVEVSHAGQHLDMFDSSGATYASETKPQYRNNFVAINAGEQYRPARITPKPRFYGTMTGFIYSEAATTKAEIDDFGRYRVILPFDRSNGTLLSTDPDRKASTWMRMAQPYVGQEQGMYFPLLGGTEVLLTFINGDPDQPVISGALPNASQPSLLTSDMNLQRTITRQVSQTVSGNTHKVSLNSAAITALGSSIGSNDSGISDNAAAITALQAQLQTDPGTAMGTVYINGGINQSDVKDGTRVLTGTDSMIPPWEGKPLKHSDYNAALIKFPLYNESYTTSPMNSDHISDEFDEGADNIATNANTYEAVSTDRGAGDNYIYSSGRTFAYPQHERVFFIGTFHEDFHVKDGFLDKTKSWTGEVERWNFPAPGMDYPAGTKGNGNTNAEVNPSGIRGVSEDKRWGDQMTYGYGRQFNWGAGPGVQDTFETINYGNSWTEELINSTGGRLANVGAPQKDMYKETGATPEPDRPSGGVSSPYEPQDYTKQFVDKPTGYTFVHGNTYSYQKGDDLDVNEGNSDMWCWGNVKDYVFGHCMSWVNGDSASWTLGSNTDMLFGNSNSLTIGLTTDTQVGLQTETFIGGKLELGLSATVVFGSTSDSRAEAKAEKMAAQNSNVSLTTQEAALNKAVSALKNDIKALSHRVDAADVSITAINYTANVAVFNVFAVFVKIG
jgi:type VI secretion system VgrG family protein